MTRTRLLLLGLGLAALAAACAAKGTTGTGTGGSTGGCGSGQMECNGSCANVLTDSQNCGTCGLVCDTDAACQGGTCVAGGSTGGTTGSGGSATGATTGTGGNTPTGGTTGAGGTTATGGTTGTGGSGSAGTSGTGGTGTTNQPVLVTSAASGYWKTTGALTTVTSGTADRDGQRRLRDADLGGLRRRVQRDRLERPVHAQPERSRQAIDLLFGSDAARFAFGRIPIGASDYSCALSGSTFVSTKSSCDFMKIRYTDDEGGSDPTMANFSIARDMAEADPVREGRAGGRTEHPAPLGQPLDAADLDEDGPVLGQRRQHDRQPHFDGGNDEERRRHA